MLRGIKRKIWNFTNFALHSLQFFTMHYVSIQRTKHCSFDFISRIFFRHIGESPSWFSTEDDTTLSRSSVSKSQCGSNRNEIHLSLSHVRGEISMQAARALGQSKIETEHRARSLACRIKAQQTSNTSSHAKQHADACPPVRRVVIPYGANRRIDPLWAHTSPRIRSRIPTERLGSIVGSRGKPESGEPEGEKSAARGARGAGGRWGRGSE